MMYALLNRLSFGQLETRLIRCTHRWWQFALHCHLRAHVASVVLSFSALITNSAVEMDFENLGF